MKMKCMKSVFYPHASTRTGSVKKKSIVFYVEETK